MMFDAHGHLFKLVGGVYLFLFCWKMFVDDGMLRTIKKWKHPNLTLFKDTANREKQ